MPQPIHIVLDKATEESSLWTSIKDIAPWVTIFIGVLTFAWSLKVRSDDLKWKRAEALRGQLKAIQDDARCQKAITLLDVRGGILTSDDGVKNFGRVFHKDIFKALENLLVDSSLNPNEERDLYIRQCFDALLVALADLEFGLKIGQFEFNIVRERCLYWIKCIAGMPQDATTINRTGIVTKYCQDTDSLSALAFLNRFPEFKSKH